MRNDNGDMPSKDQVVETVLDILVRITGHDEREQLSGATNPAKDLHVDTDDLSVFIAEVERHFHIDAPQVEWFGIDGTIESVSSLVLRHLSK